MFMYGYQKPSYFSFKEDALIRKYAQMSNHNNKHPTSFNLH
jgi:hypothetical protein